MADRINAIDTPGGAKVQSAPKGDSSAVLLAQGLQSHDNEILNRVLQRSNDSLIHTTVQRLSVNLVIPLIQELMKRLGGDPQKYFILNLKWQSYYLIILDA